MQSPLIEVKIDKAQYTGMDYKSFSTDLMTLYQEMSHAFSSTQSNSKLTCPSGCGYCCKTPTVEASVLEMIPMALSLIEQGLADEVINKIESTQPTSCILYEDHGGKQGRCTQYATRPSLCRMFGVAGLHGKNREIKLSICKELKETYPDYHTLNPVELAPALMSEWSARLIHLHPGLNEERLPISMALYTALEKVMLYGRLSESN